jgi:hypothetical protein
MPDMEVEKPVVGRASKTVDSEIEKSENPDRSKSEDPLTKPATGRLPARAFGNSVADRRDLL